MKEKEGEESRCHIRFVIFTVIYKVFKVSGSVSMGRCVLVVVVGEEVEEMVN